MDDVMRIVETMHERKTYWLVFDGMEIVHKAETKEEAQAFIAHATSTFTA